MKSSIKILFQFLFLSLMNITILSLPTSQPYNVPTSHTYHGLENILHQFSQWRNHQLSSQNNSQFNNIMAWILCFIASFVSSACGLGGGSLFLLILTLVAGLDLKSATAFNSFMVAAGTLCNVIYTLCFLDKSLVNYEITLLSEPCMLLGVSIGVLCNIMFPEWLITALFAVILAISTAKTVQSGCKIWRAESEGGLRVEVVQRQREAEETLILEERGGRGNGVPNLIPRKELLILIMIWMCFFVLHILLGDKNGKGLVDINPCGVAFWLITLSQIPIAIGFTSYMLDPNEGSAINGTFESLPRFVFPVAATLTGALSGLFGIGGGLIINPVFIQIGVPPQTAAATSSLMVLFSASMSMVQHILLGMRRIDEAVKYAILCFAAAIIGLVTLQTAIRQSGRVSLIVFLVSAVMATSTVAMTLFGALDVWRQISNGEYMGFKMLC